MSLYNCKSTSAATPFRYVMTKFDNDLNPESSYIVSISDCSCPAGYRPTCRHRQMLPLFVIQNNFVDEPMFFDFDTRNWLSMGEKEDDHGESSKDIQATLGSDSVA